MPVLFQMLYRLVMPLGLMLEVEIHQKCIKIALQNTFSLLIRFLNDFYSNSEGPDPQKYANTDKTSLDFAEIASFHSYHHFDQKKTSKTMSKSFKNPSKMHPKTDAKIHLFLFIDF